MRLEISTNAAVRWELLLVLVCMGCDRLFHVLWEVQNAEIIKEFFTGTIPRPFIDNLVQSKANYSVEECCKMTYGFLTLDIGYNEVTTDKAFATRFPDPAHELYNFRVNHYINTREKRVLKFLVPVLNSEKPTIVTNKLMKANFESFSGNYVIV